MTWPAVVLWLCFIAGAFSPGPALLYLFGISGCFGTLQMLPGDSIGGVNVLPQVVCAALLVAKVLWQRGAIVRAMAVAVDPSRAGLLTGFLVYSVLTAIALPRIFAGQIEVVPVSGGIVEGTSILVPGMGNVTQSGYLILSTLTVVSFASIGSHKIVQHHYLMSLLFGGMALIVTGLIDLLFSSLGLTALLDPFRNASYSLLIDNMVLGSKRVVGLTPEASVFGSSCVMALCLLTLTRPCFDLRWRRTYVPATIVGLLVMSALSTSSSAYIGLVVFFAVFGANWLVRFHSPNALAREDLPVELIILVAAAFALLAIVVLVPTLLDPVTEMIDHMVFQKTSSSSYFERTMWTRVGWEAFLSTNLLGVGFGAVRTSNWFVSILGSTGFCGGLLMFGFVIQGYILSPAPRTGASLELKRAYGFSLLPWLTMSAIGGTIPDIGVAIASVFGMIIANRRLDVGTQGGKVRQSPCAGGGHRAL